MNRLSMVWLPDGNATAANLPLPGKYEKRVSRGELQSGNYKVMLEFLAVATALPYILTPQKAPLQDSRTNVMQEICAADPRAEEVSGLWHSLLGERKSAADSASAQSEKVFREMCAQFESYRFDTPEEQSRYRRSFDALSHILRDLYMREFLVDISRVMELVDFKIDLGEGLLLTAGLEAGDGPEAPIMFSLSEQGNSVVLDECEPSELLSRVRSLQEELRRG